MTMIDNAFNDCGAKDSLPASRYTIEPKERSWGGLPISKEFALNKPSTGFGMALFLCLVMV